MIRNAKRVGLVLVAVLALSAVAAAGASAEEHTFRSGLESGQTTYLTGTTEEGTVDKFTIGSILGTQAVECHEHLQGEAIFPEDAHALTTTSEYSNCEFHGEPGASVDMNGCAYVFTTETDENGDAKTEIECPEPTSETENMIEVTSPLCDMWIGAQVGEEGLSYTNTEENGKDAITVRSTLKVHIHAKQATVTCFSIASTGTYEGTMTLTGYSDAEHTNQVGIALNEKPPPPSTFHLESTPATLIGDGTTNQMFVLNAGTAECEESGFKGSSSTKAPPQLYLEPGYASCEAFGYPNAEAKANGCSIALYGAGTAGISCPEGEAVEIVAKVASLTKCTATIGAQGGLSSVT